MDVTSVEHNLVCWKLRFYVFCVWKTCSVKGKMLVVGRFGICLMGEVECRAGHWENQSRVWKKQRWRKHSHSKRTWRQKWAYCVYISCWNASPNHFSSPFILVCFCLGSRKAQYCFSVCSQGGPSRDFVLGDKYMSKILLGVSAQVLAFFLRGTAVVYINLSPFSFLPALNMNVTAGSAVAIM